MIMNAEENIAEMLLTPWNSTNPQFWGYDLVYENNAKIYQTKSDLPTEFDFFNTWCGKDPVNAKHYYGL